jgi:TolB-like protein/predicted Ser/Thr protein kinase
MEHQPDRWAHVGSLFEQATGLRGAARVSFLEETCSSDPALRQELERLLAAHEAAGDFLKSIDPLKSAALLAATQEPELTPDTVGRYRIVRRLGSGAMGVVYLAHDPELDRPIALKLLRPQRSSPAARRRLLEEARAASALDHPNVAVIHEVGQTEDDRPFIAMAYCEGESLAERLERGPLTDRIATDIARQAASALAAAHALGIVHCDVKPANIILSADGRVRLMDFGVARVAGRPGPWGNAIAGTPAYMSPEQLLGGEPDRGWDIWALGVLLHELLTGHRPAPRTGERTRSDPLRDELENARDNRPALPPALETLIGRCLHEDPRERPAATDVAVELQAFLDRESTVPARLWIGVTAAAAAVLALAITLARPESAPVAGAPGTDASVIVFPFTPVVGDTALSRLGRELVVTLGASLDGVAGMRVVAPITVLGQLREGEEGTIALARQLGAGWRVSGQVTRSAGTLRVDAAVHGVNDDMPIARVTARASGDDITALTDSLALGLLRSAWLGHRGSVPNLAALTTRSVPALRAYLEGELAIASASFRPAALAFARAFQTDTAFWFAYWRYLYARSYHSDPLDSSIVATVVQHRSAFPEPDRLLVEARMQSGQRARLELRRAVTQRYPAYWPAWFEFADQLTHHGPLIGVPLDEARIALRRFVDLNPRFTPAVEHLFWTAILLRDPAESGRALARLIELRLDTLAGDRTDLQTVNYYRYLDHLNRTRGDPDPGHSAIGTRVLAEYTGSIEPEALATSLASFGFYRAQIDLAQRVIGRRPPPRIAAAQLWGIALSWAGRGAWDSAFVAARQYARTTTHPHGPIWAYALATTGAWLGAIEPDSAALLRMAAGRAQAATSEAGVAELHWLDGILACTRADTAALRVHHASLRSSAATGASALARSLAAFDLALAGRSADAAHGLTVLERENADEAWHFRHGKDHPFALGVNRLAASRMLLAAGDTATAAELLLFHEVDLPSSLHPMPTATIVLGTLGLADLARIEDRRGQSDLAHHHRAILDERVDFGREAESACLR